MMTASVDPIEAHMAPGVAVGQAFSAQTNAVTLLHRPAIGDVGKSSSGVQPVRHLDYGSFGAFLGGFIRMHHH